MKTWHLIVGAALALVGGRYAWMRYQRGRWQVVSYDLAVKAMIAADPTHAASYRLLPKDGVLAPTGPLAVGTPVFFALRRDGEDVAAGFVAAGTVAEVFGGNVVVSFTNGAYEADMSREIPYVPEQGTLYTVRTEDVRPAGLPSSTPGTVAPLGINASEQAWYARNAAGIYVLTKPGMQGFITAMVNAKAMNQGAVSGVQAYWAKVDSIGTNGPLLTTVLSAATNSGKIALMETATIDRMRAGTLGPTDGAYVYVMDPSTAATFIASWQTGANTGSGLDKLVAVAAPDMWAGEGGIA